MGHFNWLVSEGSTYPAGKIVYEVGGGYEARFTAGALPGNFHCYLLPVRLSGRREGEGGSLDLE